MSSRETVNRTLEEFEREFPGERGRMAACLIGFIEETSARLRRARAAAEYVFRRRQKPGKMKGMEEAV